MKCHQVPLTVAGIIFSLMAIFHLLRLYFGWSIVFGAFVLPVWASWIGLIIAGGLGIWMLRAACYDKCT